MKPGILNQTKILSPGIEDNLVSFYDNTNINLKDSGIESKKLKDSMENTEFYKAHIEDSEVHVTQEEKDIWNARPDIYNHVVNSSIHVTPTDRDNWNNKETIRGAQAKANIVQTNLNLHINDIDKHVSIEDKNKWNNTYTKEELNNKLSALEFNIDWKESVNTKSELYIVYPSPYDGWTVNVLDTDITYRYTGDDWIAISANAIPMASSEVDGKMSKDDKIKLDGMEANANFYIHPNDEYTRHVSDQQIEFWNSKASSSLVTYKVNGQMSIADKKKLDTIEEYATHYEHPETHSAEMIEETDDKKFVSSSQIDGWNLKASTDEVTVYKNGLMSISDKVKLNGIESNANRYVHPDNHSANIVVETDNKKFVSPSEKEEWNNKLSKNDIILGTGNFNGFEVGTAIRHDLDTMRYKVIITVTSANDPDTIGSVIVIKSNNQFLVKSTGNNIMDTFDYIILKY